MMRRFAYLWVALGLLMALGSAAPAFSQDAEASDKASSGGFQALGLITSDPDWQSKWESPRENVPNFTIASVLEPGDRATVLTFFSGAVEKNGKILLKRDVEVEMTDGQTQSFETPECGPTKRLGPADDVYLTRLEIGFEINEDDPPGLLVFKIGITDVNAGKRLALTMSTRVVAHGDKA